MSPDDPRHGTKYGYQLGCREDCCTRANTRALKRWRAGLTTRRVDAVGTKRRIQALLALGWTLQEISAEAGGFAKNWCHVLLAQETVWATTAAKVTEAYDRLQGTVPVGPHRARRRRYAASRGWLPPLAWDDIDDPNEQPHMGRDSSHYGSAELVAEWDHLRRAGESIEQAAIALGVSVSAIEKACERVRKAVA